MTIEQIKGELQNRSNEDALSSNVLAYINVLEEKIKEYEELFLNISWEKRR